jgi:hypothetical protein
MTKEIMISDKRRWLAFRGSVVDKVVGKGSYDGVLHNSLLLMDPRADMGD